MLINEQNSDIPYVSRLEDTYIDSFIAERTVNKDVLFVEGARQTGKTRLILEALSRSGKHSTRLSLERDARICALINECQDFKELESVLADYVGYSPREGNILFIDEAQESRMLGRFVRFMKEEWENTTVILSGSTLRRIFRSGTRYPVGRIRRLVLWPFSFTEYLRAHNRDDLASYLQEEAQEISTKRHDYLLTLYDRYLRTGGLPAVVQKEALDLDYAELRAQIIADSNWDPNFTLSVQQTTGAPISGGESYQEVRTVSDPFFTGSTNTTIDIQYELTGITVETPADDYVTTVEYTVTDT